MQDPQLPTAPAVTPVQQVTEPAAPADGTDSLTIAATANWTARQVVLGTLTVLAVAVVFVLFYRFYMVVFLFFVGVALQIAMAPVVDWLNKHGIHRAVAVGLLYMVILAVVGILVWFGAPLIVRQTQALLNELPEYYTALHDFLLSSRFGLLRGVAYVLPSQLTLPALISLSNVDEGAGETQGPQIWQFVEIGARAIFVLFAIPALAYYWTMEGNLILRRLILRAPTHRREELRVFLAEIEGKMGAFFRGQLILCVVVGALTTLALWLLGVPNALVLGLVMGVFEAIPVVGPTLGAIPAIVLTASTAPHLVIWVIVALVGIQVAENNLLVPRIMGESVGVNAIVTLLAIAAFGALFGLAGAILAIPLAAILQILLDRTLFSAPPQEETAPDGSAPPELNRSRLSVWRLEAQDVAQSVRKQARNTEGDEPPDDEVEQTEDQIEALATELDTLLARMEGAS